MDVLIQGLLDNPVYQAIAVVMALVILFGFIRKMFKMALILTAILVIYIVYLTMTGEEVNVKRITKDVQSASKVLSKKAGEISESVIDKVGDALEE